MAKRSTWTRERREAENARRGEARARKARELNPNLPPYTPRPPRGPQSPPEDPYHIPEGQELSGLSTLADANGEAKLAWHKTRVAGADPEPLPAGFNEIPRSISVMSRGDGSEVVRWKSFKPDEERRQRAIVAAWQRHADLYRGLAGVAPRPPTDGVDEDLLVVIPIGDPHLGLLSWAPETGDHFDTKIACRELMCAVDQLITQAPRAPKIILGNLGDALHAQDDMQRTPGHGHKLDVDERYAKVLDKAHVLFRRMIERARLKYATVASRNLPGNHDERVACELAMWLEAVFEQDPNVTIEPAFRSHQYDVHGEVLIGWHHGDKSKPANLPEIMARDHSGAGTGLYGVTSYHYWLVGHVHHKTMRESPAGLVETFNTMAGADAYHAGRFRSQRYLQAITYHKRFGEVGRVTVSLDQVRAAIAAGGRAA